MLSLLTTIVAIALPSAAMSQSWPDRNITLVIPFPAGGSTDGIGRPIAGMLSKQLGKQVVIENRGGAAGISLQRQWRGRRRMAIRSFSPQPDLRLQTSCFIKIYRSTLLSTSRQSP